MNTNLQSPLFYNAKQSVIDKAIELRNEMTFYEMELWDRISNNQLGVNFRAQHPIDIFIADFYCHQHKLIIEIEGNCHDHQIKDSAEERALLRKLGIHIIYFSSEQIKKNIEYVISEIIRTIELLRN